MIERAKAFFHWLGTPIRAVRALFPFTYDGRQTLIYLMCSLAAPVLSALALYILDRTEANGQWGIYSDIADQIGWSLLIVCCAFSMFVAFRSLSLGSKDGLLSLTSKENAADPVIAARKVEEEVKVAAAQAVEKVEAAAVEHPVAPTYMGPDLSDVPESKAPEETPWR